MPNAPRVQYNITNEILDVAQPLGGVIFVEGITKRGPVSDPRELITSWPQYVKRFGGEYSGSDFPTYCKRLLERGAILRVNRITHYDTGVTTAVKAPAINIQNGHTTPENLFTFRPKYAGADYNNISVIVSAASNGDADSFDLQIKHNVEASLTETYPNLKIDGKNSVDGLTFLDNVIAQSSLGDFGYLDLSSLVGDAVPATGTTAVTGGSDGDAVVPGDYAGDSAEGSGFYAFDPYDEAYFLLAPEVSDNATNIAGASYAAARKDLIFAMNVPNTENTSSKVVTYRGTVTSATANAAFFGGGVKIADRNGQEKELLSVADAIGCFVYSSATFNPWLSFAGTNRGVIPNALGVVNNFGAPAKYTDLNLITNAQVNMLVAADGLVHLLGNFTSQKLNDQQKFLNIQVLLLYIRKTLNPVLKSYLEEPNDIPTFRRLYNQVKPFFDGISQGQGRALFGYSWNGDQNASTLDSLQINDKNDVLNGRYKVELRITPVASMQELTVDIILTTEGVEFQPAA